ncbi:hypothetical protein D3C80_1957540 [compost metagenome]
MRRVGGEAHLHAIAPGGGQAIERQLDENLWPMLAGPLPPLPRRARVVFTLDTLQSQAAEDCVIKSDHFRQVTRTDLYVAEHCPAPYRNPY